MEEETVYGLEAIAKELQNIKFLLRRIADDLDDVCSRSPIRAEEVSYGLEAIAKELQKERVEE